MCQLFIGANRELWQSSTRSMRVDGVVTSIRLETFFWETLEEIGFREDMSVSQLVTKLYLESVEAGHNINNFTSFLRVCAGRYLALIADEKLQRDMSASLANVDADGLINEEDSLRIQRKAMFAKKELSIQ